MGAEAYPRSHTQGSLEAILGTIIRGIGVKQNTEGQLDIGIDHTLRVLRTRHIQERLGDNVMRIPRRPRHGFLRLWWNRCVGEARTQPAQQHRMGSAIERFVRVGDRQGL